MAITYSTQYTEFRQGSPEEKRTIDYRRTAEQGQPANEYNFSVWNADGTPATGTIQGTILADFYSPGADRPERTVNPVDLATGCRKFNLFFQT